MGHKPDRRARKKSLETKKLREADFQKKLEAASEGARSLYETCLREIQNKRERGESTASVTAADSAEDNAAVRDLLLHPHNDYKAAYIKPRDESPGGPQYGTGLPKIVISW